ncbi:MAG: helix-turn-helix domain-containing protein [Dysgonomonas sp.]
MKDRIRLIMESERLTPSAFADKLQLGRAVISHILNGRNNPSLDVVTRILSKMNYINSDWLISGTGNMYKTESERKVSTTQQNNFRTSQNELDLFTQTVISSASNPQENEYRKEIIVEQSKKQDEMTENKQIIYQKAPERKISKIIIYYSDNTFETFNADHTPL